MTHLDITLSRFAKRHAGPAFVALSVGALSIGALSLSGHAMAQEHTLRVASVASPGNIDYDYLEELARKVTERTDGRIAFKTFHGSQLGSIKEQISSVSSGAIDMTLHDFAALSPYVEDISLFNAPYIYRDGAHALTATDPQDSEVMADFNEQIIETGNIRILGGLYRGARQLTANFAVYGPEDLEGEKIRGVPLPIWTTMLKGMGAIPTPVEWAEVPSALATGLVVGQENPLSGIVKTKIYEVQPYVMITGHMQSVLGLFINEGTWQALSEEDREIMRSVVDEMEQWSLDRVQQEEEALKEELRGEGVTVIEADDGLKTEEFRDAVLQQVEEDFPQWTDDIERIGAID